ncbi:hypothetical protein D3C73_1315580 [compost metagenome]
MRLAGLSRSDAHCDVLRMPAIGAPTAAMVSSSPEKPGAKSAMSLDRPAPLNCLMKFTPMPPGRKKKTASGLLARKREISTP